LNENDKEINLKYNKLHIILLSLMMLDFMFTYIGINKFNVISEGNPLNTWLFELPFIYAYLIRLAYSSFFVFLLTVVCKSKYKYYDFVIWFVLIVNVIVMFLHFKWTIIYLYLAL